jgi:hypothetical protein
LNLLWTYFLNTEWHDWRGSGKSEDRLDNRFQEGVPDDNEGSIHGGSVTAPARSVPDGKVLEFPARRGLLAPGPMDEASHLLLHRLEDPLHFFRRAFHDQLDPTIRQVLYISSYVMLHRDV